MKYKNIEEQEDAIKKSQEDHANTFTDSTYGMIKQLEEKVAFLERCISKLEQKIWSGSGLVERIESLEQKVWKKEVEIDHVRYEVDEQLRADAEEAGVGSIVDMMEDVGKCVSDYLEDKNENDK